MLFSLRTWCLMSPLQGVVVLGPPGRRAAISMTGALRFFAASKTVRFASQMLKTAMPTGQYNLDKETLTVIECLCPRTDAATGNKAKWLKITSLRLITSLRVCRHLSLPLRSYLSITAPSTFLSTARMRTCVHTRQNISARKQVRMNCCISHNGSY